MYSIGKLCREFNLSRSTLLYYDKIKLICASERTEANYRQYSEDDRVRLKRICDLREAGIPLDNIKDILDKEGTNEDRVLEERLNSINKEIRYLRLKQKMIIELLQSRSGINKSIPLDKGTFITILESAGFKEDEFCNFHYQLERYSPDSHQFFLEFLGLSDEEIKRIRKSSRNK